MSSETPVQGVVIAHGAMARGMVDAVRRIEALWGGERAAGRPRGRSPVEA